MYLSTVYQSHLILIRLLSLQFITPYPICLLPLTITISKYTLWSDSFKRRSWISSAFWQYLIPDIQIFLPCRFMKMISMGTEPNPMGHHSINTMKLSLCPPSPFSGIGWSGSTGAIEAQCPWHPSQPGSAEGHHHQWCWKPLQSPSGWTVFQMCSLSFSIPKSSSGWRDSFGSKVISVLGL